MGLKDKVTGRAKQAAGDLAGNAALRRSGRQEERKGEAKDELSRRDAAADRKAREVEDLERKTGGRSRPRGAAGDPRTREQLYADAQRLGVPNRSKMNKDELRRAVDAHR